MDGHDPTTDDVVALARLAEQAGFDSVWVADHFLYERRGERRGGWEGLSIAAGLACTTERVEIGTLVVNTGYRNPALLARIVDTVDALSGGRFICGLGAGDYESEHEAFGYPWERRISHFEEALQIICPMLRGESVTFEGESYRTKAAELIPKGPHPKGPPIMIGLLEGGPRMKRLVVQYADQWSCWLATTDSHADAYREPLEAMVVACKKHRRDPATLGRNVTVGVCLSDEIPDPKTAQPLQGSTNEIADEIRRFEAMGVNHLPVWLTPNSTKGVEAFAPVLEVLRAR